MGHSEWLNFDQMESQSYGREFYPASGKISLQNVCTFSYEHYKLTTIMGQLSFYKEALENFVPNGVDLKRYKNLQ